MFQKSFSYRFEKRKAFSTFIERSKPAFSRYFYIKQNVRMKEVDWLERKIFFAGFIHLFFWGKYDVLLISQLWCPSQNSILSPIYATNFYEPHILPLQNRRSTFKVVKNNSTAVN